MLKGKRTGFVAATTLNSPVVIHSLQDPQHVSKDEVLQFLDEFIQSKESGVSADTDVNLSASLSQLKRIQRDFKGLPPAGLTDSGSTSTITITSSGTSTGESSGANGEITKSATGGTKRRFSDDE